MEKKKKKKKKAVNVGQSQRGTERRENTGRRAWAWAAPQCACVFRPGVLPVPDWSPLLPLQVRLPARLLSPVPELGIRSRGVRSRFLRVQTTCGYSSVLEQFCTQSGGGLVELNEMGHFQSKRGFYSAASFLLNSHFPSHYRDSFKGSLCCWATNAFLADHEIFTSCFNFLP